MSKHAKEQLLSIQFGRYRKAVVAVVGAALVWAEPLFNSGVHIDSHDWFALVKSVLVALGVYVVSNDPPAAPTGGVTAPVPEPAGVWVEPGLGSGS